MRLPHLSPVLPVPEYNLPVPVLPDVLYRYSYGWFPHRLLHVILPFQTPAYDKSDPRSPYHLLQLPSVLLSSAHRNTGHYTIFHIPVCNPLFSYPPDLHSLRYIPYASPKIFKFSPLAIFPKKQLPYVILSHSWFFEKIFAEILEFLKKLLQFRFGLLIGTKNNSMDTTFFCSFYIYRTIVNKYAFFRF